MSLPVRITKTQKTLDFSVECDIIRTLFRSKTEYGGIAQLGERLNGIQEVSGSIPLISTTFKFRNLLISELFSLYFIIFALY